MSRQHIADNFFEKEEFVERLRKLGHPGCEVRGMKGGRYRIISPMDGKHFTELSNEFKRRKVRQLGPQYLEQQKNLI